MYVTQRYTNDRKELGPHVKGVLCIEPSCITIMTIRVAFQNHPNLRKVTLAWKGNNFRVATSVFL